jgi:hypothetical protein
MSWSAWELRALARMDGDGLGNIELDAFAGCAQHGFGQCQDMRTKHQVLCALGTGQQPPKTLGLVAVEVAPGKGRHREIIGQFAIQRMDPCAWQGIGHDHEPVAIQRSEIG